MSATKTPDRRRVDCGVKGRATNRVTHCLPNSPPLGTSCGEEYESKMLTPCVPVLSRSQVGRW